MHPEHEALLAEIRRAGQNRPSSESASYAGTAHTYLGVPVPVRRRIAKQWLREHKELSSAEILAVVDSFFEGESHEEKTFAAILLACDPAVRRSVGPAHVDRWLSHLTGWAEVDSLCQNGFAADEMLADWASWRRLIVDLSRDDNINKRRASLVLLTGPVHYSGDQRLSDLAFATIATLELERDILITKAVSWLLRSLLSQHRAEVTRYLSDHEATLPKLAIRETRTKLETGTKSGRTWAPDAQARASAFYSGLVAELYGPLRSQVPDPEPYAQFVARYGEPALELGCGTGDPILALRERGLDVDGVDSSADMLAKCRAAAETRGIEVALFEQAMETLDLPRRYRTIYLAGPTFNLLTDDGAARDALTRIRAHLDLAGAALVPLFIPSPTPQQQLGVAREHVTDDGRVQRVTAVSETRDNRKRLQTTVLRYESTLDGETETIERPWLLHWHTQAGFTKLAKAAGLTIEAVVAPRGGAAQPDDDAFVFVLRPKAPAGTR